MSDMEKTVEESFSATESVMGIPIVFAHLLLANLVLKLNPPDEIIDDDGVYKYQSTSVNKDFSISEGVPLSEVAAILDAVHLYVKELSPDDSDEPDDDHGNRRRGGNPDDPDLEMALPQDELEPAELNDFAEIDNDLSQQSSLDLSAVQYHLLSEAMKLPKLEEQVASIFAIQQLAPKNVNYAAQAATYFASQAISPALSASDQRLAEAAAFSVQDTEFVDNLSTQLDPLASLHNVNDIPMASDLSLTTSLDLSTPSFQAPELATEIPAGIPNSSIVSRDLAATALFQASGGEYAGLQQHLSAETFSQDFKSISMHDMLNQFQDNSNMLEAVAENETTYEMPATAAKQDYSNNPFYISQGFDLSSGPKGPSFASADAAISAATGGDSTGGFSSN